MTTDRNLLVGILAVKLDFVSREALVEATRAWQADKTRPLADLLPITSDRRLLLDALVAEQLKTKDVPQALAEMSSLDWVRDAFKDVQDADIERTINFIPSPVDGTVQQVGASPAVRAVSSRSGSRFRIIRPHARGGLGEVYVAEDTELGREVALKEIQPQHSGNENTRGRFVLEAEVTGGLEHPNIVPVYGLGTYADGRPYYAMRFIRGDSLKDAIERFYAPQSTASPAERNLEFRNLLKRFVDVCNAIAYAHSRGILHRDLKPGNIMLGKYGETLVVDWGLAKSVTSRDLEGVESTEPGERHLTPSSGSYAETQAGSIVGTPAFMSPEQAAAKFEDLGPAADVYSLGATLYVILTGKPPFAGDVIELLRKVEACDFSPPKLIKPDTPAALNAVVLKAMAKEPKERYQTPTQLAQEVERFLADEPVKAIREPFSVRTKRWARKHPRTVAGLAAALLVGIAGLGAGLYFVNAEKDRTELARQDEAKQRALAENQEQKALAEEAIAKRRLANVEKSNEIMASIFENLDPSEIAKAERPLQAIRAEKIDQAIALLDRDSIGDELAVAKLQNKLGISLLGLGKPEKAIVVFERCRALMNAKHGPDHPHMVAILNHLARSYESVGRPAEAVGLYEEALRLQKSIQGEDHPDTLASMNNLAIGYHSVGRLAAALPLYEESLKICRTKLGPDHPHTITGMGNLAGGYRSAGRLSEAIPLLEETIKLMKDKLGHQHPNTLRNMFSLAQGYESVGRMVEAMSLFEETLKLRKVALGPDHSDTQSSIKNLAKTYESAGRLSDVLPLSEEMLAFRKAKLGAEHPDTLTSMNSLAYDYLSAGRQSKAMLLFEKTLKIRRAKLGPEHIDTLTNMSNLASCYKSVGQLTEALPLHLETLRLRKAKLGPDDSNTITSMNNLANMYMSVGRLAEALPLFDAALSGLAKKNYQHVHVHLIIPNACQAYEDARLYERAEKTRRNWLVLVRAKSGADSATYASELAGLSGNLIQQAKWPDAEVTCRECWAIRTKLTPLAWNTFNIESMLGKCLSEQNKPGAEVHLMAGYEGLRLRRAQIPPGANRLREAVQRLVDFHADDPAKAAEWRAKLPREYAPMPRATIDMKEMTIEEFWQYLEKK